MKENENHGWIRMDSDGFISDREAGGPGSFTIVCMFVNRPSRTTFMGAYLFNARINNVNRNARN